MHRSSSAENILDAKRPYPDKLFYKIGEVSRIAGVEPYVLRYWETEFSFLRPRKNKSGQRVYIKKDIDLILKIKRLLYDERYTIEGVRKRLGETETIKQTQNLIVQPSTREIVEKIRERLREILNHIS